MLLLLAVVMTAAGLLFTYIAVGMVRNNERKRGYEECEERLSLQRRQLLRRRP